MKLQAHTPSPRALSAAYLLALVLLFGIGCTTCPHAPAPDQPRYTSVEHIADSLPETPLVVGFDVDDTVLLSSPGFHYGQTNTDGPDGTNLYAGEDGKSRFWLDMNTEFDKFSIPKQSARRLIDMHKARNDRIVFITARPQTPHETLSTILGRTFGLQLPTVVFVGKSGKVDALQTLGITLYYGDSDSDITQAQEAGCRAIRVLRPGMSTYTAPANPGLFGEEVIEHSDR